jgi:alkaline phosphatase D
MQPLRFTFEKNLTMKYFTLFAFLITTLAAHSQSLVDHTRQIDGARSSNAFSQTLAPFYHGVASGDPTSSSILLWTRFTPIDTTANYDIKWKIATDTAMINVIDSGIVNTDASTDFTVNVDVTGLSGGTTYYYVFEESGQFSLIGRTRTTPTNNPGHLRFGVVSCDNYQAGYFRAYGELAEREDLDAIIHLGDYIYEYADGVYGDSTLMADGSRPLSPSGEIVTLEDYRARYSTYRLDSNFIRAHQQHPFITIWDDHETANDSWTGGAENHDTTTQGDWNTRVANAKQAYFEWLPIRENMGSIYRTISYGPLMDLVMLDTRIEGREEQILDITNPALYDPNRTILGSTQKAWLKNQLSSSSATWKVMGNQVIFSPFTAGWGALLDTTVTYEDLESTFLDIWDGYPAERTELIDYISQNNIDNTVILTGDFHSSFAFDVTDTPNVLNIVNVPGVGPLPFYDPSPIYDPVTGTGSVAVEFASPSISSANFDENTDPATAQALQFQINNDIVIPPAGPNLGNPNPHMKYADLIQHGYFLLDVKDDSTQADYYFIDDILVPNGTESYAQGAKTMRDSNKLELTAVPATQKSNPPALAPLNPPSNVTSLDKGLENGVIIGIYPNPSDELLTVHFALNATASMTFELFTMDGKQVKNMRKTIPTRIYSQQIDVSDLDSGIYMLRISDGRTSMTREVVIR